MMIGATLTAKSAGTRSEELLGRPRSINASAAVTTIAVATVANSC